MKSEKGQLISQVFIYIILLVMVSLIFLFGYKAIQMIAGSGSDLDDLSFKNEIENDINKYSIEYGSSERKKIPVPNNVNEACFVNKDAIGKDIDAPYFVIKDSVKSGVKDNLFIFGSEPNTNFRKMFVGNVSIKGNEDLICIESINGRLNIGYKGKGSYTEISAWE